MGFLPFLAQFAMSGWFKNALAGAMQLIATDDNDDLFDNNGKGAEGVTPHSDRDNDDDLFEDSPAVAPRRNSSSTPPFVQETSPETMKSLTEDSDFAVQPEVRFVLRVKFEMVV